MVFRKFLKLTCQKIFTLRTKDGNMRISCFFSEDDLRKIEAAVKQAESRISGEIVPVFTDQSDNYEIGNLRAGLTFSIVAAVIWLTLYKFASFWGGNWIYAPESLMVLMTSAFCAGFFLALFIPRFRICFMLGRELAQSVDREARLAFLRENVFETKHRTGVLILISLLEHRAEVLGDIGISARVEAKDWENVLNPILQGLKNKQKAEGICKAIELTRDLLVEKGFSAEADDTNELPDNLRH